jgi:hypothetical protein
MRLNYDIQSLSIFVLSHGKMSDHKIFVSV